MHVDINNLRYPYSSVPDNCPLCHHGIEPRMIASNVIERGRLSGDILQLIFRCPRQDCQQAFIATYLQDSNRRGGLETNFSLRNTSPYRGKDPVIPDEVKQLSANFVEVYSQAHTAEHYGLDQIAGVGYRKSLEFLVKDYCISKNPDKEQEIKAKYLGACINDFVDDTNIKECAKRAAWLGNDESHYVRKWEDKEVKDPKILLELTMAWIRNHVLTAQYLADMDAAT
jgi:hypothetical protein